MRPRPAPFVFPYHLGLARNIKEVFSHSLRRDGINWTVADGERGERPDFIIAGCDEYTLTREQLQQKAQKRQASELCIVTRRRDRCCGLFVFIYRNIYV